MGPVPTSTKFPVETVPVLPAVLPIVETPAKTPPSPAPPPEGTEITTLPFVTPTDAMPAPPKLRFPRFCVPELDCVVFETANRLARMLAIATEPLVFVKLPAALSLNPRVWHAELPPAAEKAWFDWLVSPLWLAVIAGPALVPKVMPFAFENESVWKVKEPAVPPLAAWFDCDVRALWDPTMVWEPPAPDESESVTPFRLVKARRATVPLVALSETVQLELVTVGTV